MTLGSKFTKEDPSDCKASYQVVTVIPKADCGASCAKKVKVKAKAYDWLNHLTSPTTPQAATPIEVKQALPEGLTKYMWGYYGESS